GGAPPPSAALDLLSILWISLAELYVRLEVRQHCESAIRGRRRQLLHQQLVPQNQTRSHCWSPGWRSGLSGRRHLRHDLRSNVRAFGPRNFLAASEVCQRTVQPTWPTVAGYASGTDSSFHESSPGSTRRGRGAALGARLR